MPRVPQYSGSYGVSRNENHHPWRSSSGLTHSQRKNRVATQPTPINEKELEQPSALNAEASTSAFQAYVRKPQKFIKQRNFKAKEADDEVVMVSHGGLSCMKTAQNQDREQNNERMHLKHIGSSVAEWNTYVNKSVNFDRGKAIASDALLRLPFEKSHSQRTVLTSITQTDATAGKASNQTGMLKKVDNAYMSAPENCPTENDDQHLSILDQ